MTWLLRLLETEHRHLLRGVEGLCPESAYATALCGGPAGCDHQPGTPDITTSTAMHDGPECTGPERHRP